MVDFAQAEAARAQINTWVAEQTHDRIQNILPPGVITDLTRLVLANAIWFSGAWANPFDSASTQDGPFHRLDGTTADGPLHAPAGLLRLRARRRLPGSRVPV